MLPVEDKLAACRESLVRNGFDAFVARDLRHAKELFFSEIFPYLEVRTVSWGDSMTLAGTGILDQIKDSLPIKLIDPFEENLPWRSLIEKMKQALTSDLFFTGANAITRGGRLINLDMVGNRIAALSFGPKKVVVVAGRNKIVHDLEEGINRVKNHSAPLNAKRHAFATPCASTGKCHDCNSPQRVCNSWSIIDRCFPPGRIKIVLIDQDLGL